MPAFTQSENVIDVFNMTGGLNTIKSGIALDHTEFRNCQNIRMFPKGGFMWRSGYTTLGNSPGTACTGLYMGRFSSNTNIAFRIRGAFLESMSGLNGTWTDRTNGQTITANQDNLFVFDILNDIVIAVNGVDTALQVNSSLVASNVALPGAAIASSCFAHRGYMFYVTPDKTYFSNQYDPTTVGTNNYVQPGQKQGGNNAGGVDYNGKAYIFKRHGIYATEFQPTQTDSTGTLFPFTTTGIPVVAGVGTQSPRSIVRFTTPATHKTPGQELVFFIDQFGFPRLFDGTTTLTIGSSIASSRASNILSLSNMDRTRLPYSWCLNDATNNLIYCFMSSTGVTQHDVCWILDYNYQFAWERDSYADKFNCGAIFENTSGVFTPYFANYSGQVMATGSGQTDNGTAISSYARSGDFYNQHPITQSGWKYLELRGTTGSDSQSVHVDFYQNGEDSSSSSTDITLFKQNQVQWDTINWDQFNWVYDGLTTKSTEISIEAKSLGIQFSNSTASNTAAIEGYSIISIPEGWKEES